MLYKTLFVVMVALCCFTTTETAKRRFNVEFYNFTCKKFAKNLKVFECSFEKLRAASQFVFNQRMMIDRDLGNDFEYRVWLHIKQQHSKTGVRFIDVKLNVCDVLAHSLENLLLKSMLAEMRRTSNVPYMCPIKGNVLYSMDNFTFTDKYFPTYTPFLNFTYATEFFEGSKLFATSKISGATVPQP